MAFRKIINDSEGGQKFVTEQEEELVFDQAPTKGSFNPVTSDGVANALSVGEGGAQIGEVVPSDTTAENPLVNEKGVQDTIDDAMSAISTGYIPKGNASVSAINALTEQQNGDMYVVSDSGTISDGNVTVNEGESVAWDASNSVWYKVNNYALRQFGTDQIKNLPTTITTFRTGDVIPVDGPSGTAKMSKDALLQLTAQNALADNVVSEFDSAKPNGSDGYAYHAGEPVAYQGKCYRFTANKTSGAWDSSKVTPVKESDYIKNLELTGYSCVSGSDVDISFTSITGTAPNQTATLTVNKRILINFDSSHVYLNAGTTFEGVAYTYGGLFAVYDSFARTFKRFEVFGISGSMVNRKSLALGEIALPIAKWSSGDLLYSCCESQLGAKNKIKNIFEKGLLAFLASKFEISFSDVTGSAPNRKGTLTITKGGYVHFVNGFTTLSNNTQFTDAPYTYGALVAIVDSSNKAFKSFKVCSISGASISMLTLGYNEYAIPILAWNNGNLIYSGYRGDIGLESSVSALESSVADVVSFWNDSAEEQLDGYLIRDNTALNTGNTWRDEDGYAFYAFPVEAGGRIHVVGDIDTITRFSFTTSPNYTPSIVSTPYTNATGENSHFDLTLDVPNRAAWFQMTLKKTNSYHIATLVAQSTGLVKHHTLYVSTTGDDNTGDGSFSNPYATIFKANSVITDNSEHNRYTIKVADGVYDDMELRYSGAAITSYQGIVCKPWVIYEGNVDHPENVVLKWDGSVGYEEFTYSSVAWMKCLFHFLGTSVREGNYPAGPRIVRGFKIIAENTRYAIHVESGGYGLGCDWQLTDCLIYWNGVPADPDKNANETPAAIGTGSGSFEKGLIARCKIVNTSPNNKAFMNHDALYVYDNERFRLGAEIRFDSVDFGGGLVRFRTTHGDTNIDGYNRCYLHNCIGISTFDYSLSGGSTDVDWRAEVKCCDIVNNVFATNGKLQ